MNIYTVHREIAVAGRHNPNDALWAEVEKAVWHKVDSRVWSPVFNASLIIVGAAIPGRLKAVANPDNWKETP